MVDIISISKDQDEVTKEDNIVGCVKGIHFGRLWFSGALIVCEKFKTLKLVEGILPPGLHNKV